MCIIQSWSSTSLSATELVECISMCHHPTACISDQCTHQSIAGNTKILYTALTIIIIIIIVAKLTIKNPNASPTTTDIKKVKITRQFNILQEKQ